MPYTVSIFASEDVPDTERQQAAARFTQALEASLGDAALVAPVYRAYLRLFQVWSDHERPWPVTPAELLLAEQWEAAELAATQAAFGENRYMGDAHFEIVLD
ncbi:MAG: hypothetical protein EON92_17865 [Burkholderiales bacterium]|nr:MAG: hypothetical protein EON92_17865 [Burkholderiales bacterium]